MNACRRYKISYKVWSHRFKNIATNYQSLSKVWVVQNESNFVRSFLIDYNFLAIDLGPILTSYAGFHIKFCFQQCVKYQGLCCFLWGSHPKLQQGIKIQEHPGFTFIDRTLTCPLPFWLWNNHGGMPTPQQGYRISGTHPGSILEKRRLSNLQWWVWFGELAHGSFFTIILIYILLVILIQFTHLIKEVINNGPIIWHALHLTGKPCTYQVLKNRVNRFIAKHGDPSPIVLKHVMTVGENEWVFTLLANPSLSTKRFSSSKPQDGKNEAVSIANDKVLEFLPEWCDKDKIDYTMTHWKTWSSLQITQDNFAKKSTKLLEINNYKLAFSKLQPKSFMMLKMDPTMDREDMILL